MTAAAPGLALAPVARAATDKARVVVVGHGMVGHHFCERLTSSAAARARFHVAVLGDEPAPAYDRIRLGAVVTGAAPARLQLAAPGWAAARGIDLRLGDPVTTIDLDARVVLTASGGEAPYDHLVLATGARPRVPPVEGLADPEVLAYRTLADAERIRRAAQGATTAAVVGGGLLGLEAADGLRELGLGVTVIETAAYLLPRQLDPAGGEHVARAMRARGVDLRVGRQLRAVRRLPAPRPGRPPRWLVAFADGELLVVDLLLLAAGVAPDDRVARQAGLRCGVAGGVVVDETLRASAARVYAIGDCALHHGVSPGLVAPGYAMAEVLAARLCGEARTYRARPPSTRLEVAGVDVSVLGDVAAGGRVVVAPAGAAYRKLIVDAGVVRGAIAVGAWPERDAVERAITEGRRVSRRGLRRFARQGALWPAAAEEPATAWPDAAVVCHCVGVSCGALRQALASGCRSVDALRVATAAGSVCGGCQPRLAELAGAPPVRAARVASPWLARLSLLAASLVALCALAPPWPLADTFAWPWWEAAWREPVVRRITGFVLLGLCLVAAALSVRKRLWPTLGALAAWRAVHAAVGALTLVGLAVHTGLRGGDNLNRWLLVDLLLVNALGAAAGVWLARRPRTAREGAWQARVRWLHVAVLAPLPALIAFHVLVAYRF